MNHRQLLQLELQGGMNLVKKRPYMGTICMQGESSAMGAKGGSHANAAELVSPRNYEVESTSVQLTPVRGNEQAADVTPVKSEEGNDEKGKN
ncbi:hypothetical protein Bca101_032650 [Brassica carinata]